MSSNHPAVVRGFHRTITTYTSLIIDLVDYVDVVFLPVLRVREDEWVWEPSEESSNEHKGVVGRRCVDNGTGIPAPFMWLHDRSGRAAIALLCAAVTRSQSTTPQGTGEETPTGCSLRNGLVAEDRDTFGDLYKILFEMQKLSRESFRGDGPSQLSRGPFLRQILPTTYLVGTVHTPKRLDGWPQSRDIGPVTPPGRDNGGGAEIKSGGAGSPVSCRLGGAGGTEEGVPSGTGSGRVLVDLRDRMCRAARSPRRGSRPVSIANRLQAGAGAGGRRYGRAS